jgi:phosphonate transport system substrate-binding protein
LSGFAASSNTQLVPIRQLELARERGKIESDANMAADEKQRRLQEIDGKLAELGRLVASAK